MAVVEIPIARARVRTFPDPPPSVVLTKLYQTYSSLVSWSNVSFTVSSRPSLAAHSTSSSPRRESSLPGCWSLWWPCTSSLPWYVLASCPGARITDEGVYLTSSMSASFSPLALKHSPVAQLLPQPNSTSTYRTGTRPRKVFYSRPR